MNYTNVINALKTATLFDLFRLGVAIAHELENPEKIKLVRHAFKVGDKLTFFDETTNGLRPGIVIEKNIKYVSMLDEVEHVSGRYLIACLTWEM
jgi:hypothetical protein